jgi:hypothetical protein
VEAGLQLGLDVEEQRAGAGAEAAKTGGQPVAAGNQRKDIVVFHAFGPRRRAVAAAAIAFDVVGRDGQRIEKGINGSVPPDAALVRRAPRTAEEENGFWRRQVRIVQGQARQGREELFAPTKPRTFLLERFNVGQAQATLEFEKNVKPNVLPEVNAVDRLAEEVELFFHVEKVRT